MAIRRENESVGTDTHHKGCARNRIIDKAYDLDARVSPRDKQSAGRLESTPRSSGRRCVRRATILRKACHLQDDAPRVLQKARLAQLPRRVAALCRGSPAENRESAPDQHGHVMSAHGGPHNARLLRLARQGVALQRNHRRLVDGHV